MLILYLIMGGFEVMNRDLVTMNIDNCIGMRFVASICVLRLVLGLLDVPSTSL